MKLGQRFESARRLSKKCRFAGKTPSDAQAPALHQGRFTATQLLQSTNHSACRLIFASRRYLAPLRGMARSRPAGRRGTGAATPERLLWTSSGSLCARKLAVRGVTTTLAGLAGQDPNIRATGPAPAAASGTQTSRRIVKRHKGIKGQPQMRFDSLSHEALLQRHERAALSTK
jgi:hypothetical protein